MRLLEDEPSEEFAILCLNTKLRVLAYHEVSRGSLDTSLAHPREVFRAAILANAAAIILGHYVSGIVMLQDWGRRVDAADYPSSGDT